VTPTAKQDFSYSLDGLNGGDLRSKIDRLTARKEELERELATLGGPVAAWIVPSVQEIADALPAGTMLVEYVRTNDWLSWSEAAGSNLPLPQARYHAFVLRRPRSGPSTLRWFDVGSADRVDSAVADWRESISASPLSRDLRLSEAPVARLSEEEALKRLGETIAKDWIDQCDEVDRLLIAPDGIAHFVPWSALIGSDGRHVVEKTCVALVDRGADLAAPVRGRSARGGALLVGGLDYGAPGERTEGRMVWQALAGSQREIEAVAETLADEDAVSLVGPDATEARFMSHAREARLIHLATHGYYLAAGGGDSGSWRDPQVAAAVRRNPLARCGLALSQANELPGVDEFDLPQGDDGLLTGEELLGLDLRDVDLAVLSACESGVGEVSANEGLLGMQRALRRAGVRAAICSQWSVDDEATSRLMTDFYRNLDETPGEPAKALRLAQLAMLEEGRDATTSDRERPYYWAAFSLYGAGAPALATKEP
jgi:CHAT domain-containing protein